MKLVRLKMLASFRSLSEGFEMNFRSQHVLHRDSDDLSDFNPFCLVGLNGSGKSNVLEALSGIFFHLDSCTSKYKPTAFTKHFDPKTSTPTGFEVEYFIGLNNGSPYVIQNFYKVRILKEPSLEPKMYVQSYPFSSNQEEVAVSLNSQFGEAAPARIYLPDLVVGYSSGENEILSHAFIKTRFIHFDEYIEAVAKNYFYSEPESSLVYIDEGMSQAVLLSNMLFQDDDTLKPLRENLGVCAMRSFRININMHEIKVRGEKENYIKQNIIKQLDGSIDSLKACSTCWYEYIDESGLKHLVLDYWVNEATKLAFKEHFQNAFTLFRLFQVLYTLNNRIVTDDIKEEVYQSKGFYIDGKIPHAAPSDHVFYFLDFLITKENKNSNSKIDLLLRNFSDGEHQFLHTIGICLMLKNHRTLLLLDEPETHFNPNWRSKFIKTLRDSIKAGGGNNLLKEVLMTSHSPFIISDSKSKFVHIFKKNNNDITTTQTAENINLNTFGTSVNLITMKVFGKTETIADLSNDKISEIKHSFEQGDITADEALQIANQLGESLEKTLLIVAINNKPKNDVVLL
ncbi:restriction system-associated AAA family ATPase [Hymenobacter koreensis]|uniref:Restriction system-associated AAA family ATPase n=1 Tax=Hymenobacter koreensis TaxID=1084523 RepID=A0ABP8IY36_9BACT